MDLWRFSTSSKATKYSYLGYLKCPHISTTIPALTVFLKLTTTTYGNYISQRLLTTSESTIKTPMLGTHMRPTAIPSVILRHTTKPFEFEHSGSRTTYDFAPPHAHCNNGSNKQMIPTNTVQWWYTCKHSTSWLKKQSHTGKNERPTKARSPGYSYQAPTNSTPPTIQTKPVINDKEQQAREWVEMDRAQTAQVPEMDFSKYKTQKRVEMDITISMQEPVEWV